MRQDQHPVVRRAGGIVLGVVLTCTTCGCTAAADPGAIAAARSLDHAGLPALVALRLDPTRRCPASCFAGGWAAQVPVLSQGLRLPPRPVAWPRLR